MSHKYKILHDSTSETYKVGTMIQDNHGIKWQLIQPNKWVKYNYSYMHKTKYKCPNLKTNRRK